MWPLYSGAGWEDEKNWGHRFFPHFGHMDDILDGIWVHGEYGFVGSQILLDNAVWGYTLVQFKISELKEIRNEIMMRIIITSLLFGIAFSFVVRRI